MTIPTAPAFVQIGATRDGLDPYLDCARRRGLPAVLVETPAYLRWKALLGRRPFDLELPVDQPENADRVLAALRSAGIARPALVLTGFERYVRAGFAVAAAIGTPPWPAAGERFVPPDKLGQRTALAEHAPRVRQPAYARWNGTRSGVRDGLRFPQVVKPVDGGGGLGVFLVDNAAQRNRAIDELRATENYGGGAFAGVLVEEFVGGVEYSLQGLAVDGAPLILSVCEKLVVSEPGRDPAVPRGFRESGHIASHGAYAAPELVELATACLAATGYREGPFHVDAIVAGRDTYFVEMGFRLSGGGLVALVARATGLNWAELVFDVHLDRHRPVLGPHGRTPAVVGQVTFNQDERAAVDELLRVHGAHAEVRLIDPAPPAAILSAPELARLASDRLRHTGAAGRLTTWGERASDVRSRLSDCIAGRLRSRSCAG